MATEKKAMKSSDKTGDTVKLSDISANTYLRLLSMRQEANETAKIMMTHPDAYPDFFVETAINKFHEYIGPIDKKSNAENIRVRITRMSMVDRLRNGASGYSDFFVDSPRNGPPFHEAFLDKGPPPPKDQEFPFSVSDRVQVLSRLTVIQAYLNMIEKA